MSFNLPFELCEKIFEHLSIGELLNCTLVCRAWNLNVGATKSFEKVVLRIDQDSIEVIRSYKYLKLVKVHQANFIEYLRVLGPSARRIEIIDCCAEENVEPLHLSNLKELTLSKVSGDVFKALMSLHENLQVLNVHHLNLKRGVNDLIEFMKLNVNLKEINFYLNDSSNSFQDGFSEITRFKLTSVTVSFPSNFEIDSRTLANVEKFLMAQGKTLETITLINAASVSSIYGVWNYLKTVKRLHFFTADPFLGLEFRRPPLEVNRSLESLEFHILGPFSLDLVNLIPLLSNASNLKSLGVWRLDRELLEFSAINLNRLEIISCATMEDHCEAFYELLKAKSGTNKKMKLHQYL